MIKNNKINLKKSFSMVELMVSLSILIIVGLMVVVTATKKTEKAVTELTGAEYACYKDNSGNLHQVATAYYFGGKSSKSSDEIVNNCTFTLPSNATNAEAYVIGGGGGGGGLVDITDNSIIMGTNTTWQNIWQKVTETSETKIQPVDCYNNSEHYYYDSNVGGYADCCTDTQCGIVTSIGSKLSGSNCPNIDINIRTTLNTAPSSKTITNMLSSYMTNEAYNNLLLKNYVISVKGGGASSYYNYATNLSINDDILCYNGAASISNTGIGTTYISPTPGIIEINGKIVKKVKGASWALSSNSGANTYRDSAGGQNYGAIETNTNTQPYTLHYKTVILVDKETKYGAVKVPYGKNGEAGETITIKGLNLASKKIVIKADNIGNGGIGGQKSTDSAKAQGGNGGTTTYTVNGTTRTAAGGTGGGVAFKSRNYYYNTNLNRLDKGNSSDDTTWWTFNGEPSKAKTDYTDRGYVSGYISNILNSGKSGVIDTNTYRAQPKECNETTKSCLTGIAPIAESYGAGGMGANSLLTFGVNYKFALVKKTNGIITDKNHVLIGTFNGVDSYTPLIYKPELFPTFKGNDIPTNNGNGGAIIIKWGEALN